MGNNDKRLPPSDCVRNKALREEVYMNVPQRKWLMYRNFFKTDCPQVMWKSLQQ